MDDLDGKNVHNHNETSAIEPNIKAVKEAECNQLRDRSQTSSVDTLLKLLNHL